MRLLKLSVPEERSDAVLGVLRNHELGFVVTKTTDGADGLAIVEVVVPADAVERLLEELERVGYDRTSYTVSLEAEFATFEGVDAVQERWARTPNKLAPTTLRSKAKDLRRNTRSFLWMMTLSALVATAGLVAGSPAVIVGSMVIAPIVQPALTAVVGTVRNDRDMLVGSLHEQGLGLALAIVVASTFAAVLRVAGVVPHPLAIAELELVGLRIAPTTLSLAVGLAAGAAGAYGLATKGQATIVGVMIAAALIPTAAAVGVGVAWGDAVVAAGAGLLVALSLAGIHVGGVAMLWYLGYRPDSVDESILAFEDRRRAVVVGVTLLVVAATVGVAAVATARQSDFDRSVNAATSEVLADGDYADLELRSISTAYLAPLLADRTEVTVTLARPADATVQDLPATLAERIADRTDREVVVTVRFVEQERSDPVRSVDRSAPLRGGSAATSGGPVPVGPAVGRR